MCTSIQIKTANNLEEYVQISGVSFLKMPTGTFTCKAVG